MYLKQHSKHGADPHIVKATCTPLREIIRATSRDTSRPQIDIQSASPHCFPINPYWEKSEAFGNARTSIRDDISPSNRNLFMKIYCIRHYRTRILFLRERPRGTKSPYSIPFLHTSHTWVSSEGNTHGFCLNT